MEAQLAGKDEGVAAQTEKETKKEKIAQGRQVTVRRYLINIPIVMQRGDFLEFALINALLCCCDGRPLLSPVQDDQDYDPLS